MTMYTVYQVSVLCLAMIWLSSHVMCNEKIKNMDGSFFMTKQLRHTYRHMIVDRSGDKYSNWIEASDVKIENNVTSTCPWRFRLVWNPNRVPETFVEAECLAQQCLNITSTQGTAAALAKQDFQSDTKCSKVEYARWIQEKYRKRNGKIGLRKRLIMINVGCTCNHKSYVDVNN
ncbi:interleukin-17F-like [Biomphalaria glabrata]|uniref:Interleukin-17F-like n=1 Tax=Biomphalaria glabrata TaxID=6526 RepID=A0A9W2YJN8_BIOGL|nr:interleukin-17F-like [Biomphalaria glabrata]